MNGNDGGLNAEGNYNHDGAPPMPDDYGDHEEDGDSDIVSSSSKVQYQQNVLIYYNKLMRIYSHDDFHQHEDLIERLNVILLTCNEWM